VLHQKIIKIEEAAKIAVAEIKAQMASDSPLAVHGMK